MISLPISLFLSLSPSLFPFLSRALLFSSCERGRNHFSLSVSPLSLSSRRKLLPSRGNREEYSLSSIFSRMHELLGGRGRKNNLPSCPSLYLFLLSLSLSRNGEANLFVSPLSLYLARLSLSRTSLSILRVSLSLSLSFSLMCLSLSLSRASLLVLSFSRGISLFPVRSLLSCLLSCACMRGEGEKILSPSLPLPLLSLSHFLSLTPEFLSPSLS